MVLNSLSNSVTFFASSTDEGAKSLACDCPRAGLGLQDRLVLGGRHPSADTCAIDPFGLTSALLAGRFPETPPAAPLEFPLAISPPRSSTALRREAEVGTPERRSWVHAHRKPAHIAARTTRKPPISCVEEVLAEVGFGVCPCTLFTKDGGVSLVARGSEAKTDDLVLSLASAALDSDRASVGGNEVDVGLDSWRLLGEPATLDGGTVSETCTDSPGVALDEASLDVDDACFESCFPSFLPETLCSFESSRPDRV
mmetsp:Transcript_29913/g.91816  ORF Transcript_29913/g.91816 Transcript_29913/m.91816 type:complete len:255 (-) Transcript_29913:1209-1973(-)|eukprot:scaffold20945_cov33-Tisochrysis_lutea.AAC.3